MKIRFALCSLFLILILFLSACANPVAGNSESVVFDGLSITWGDNGSPVPLSKFAGDYVFGSDTYRFNSDGNGIINPSPSRSVRAAGSSTPFIWEIISEDSNNSNIIYGMLFVGNTGSGITFDTSKTPNTVTINGQTYTRGGLANSGGDSSGSGGDGSGSQGGGNTGGDGNGSQGGNSSGGQSGGSGGSSGSTPESTPTDIGNGKWQLFAPGVNMTGGWHDATKTQSGGGYSFSEVNLCWAATSANVIAWWQDRYNALHPTQKISSELPQTAQNIFQKFKSCWTDDTHGGFKDGVPWYMAGIASGAKENGGYLIDYIDIKQWNLLFGVTAYKYAENKNIATLSDFSKEIIAGLKKGAIALGISNNSGTGHAITIWGAEYNSQNLVTAIWVSDSDDLKIGAQGLVKYEVSQENGYVKIHNHYYGYDRIKNILILYAP